MGGLIRTPKIVTPGVAAAPAAAPVAVPTVQQAETVSAEAGKLAEVDARKAAQIRSRRGMAGTIATSARGVLGGPVTRTVRKSLLGE